MNRDHEVDTNPRILELDSTLFALDPETERFFKAETGIQDSGELRKHILEAQGEAYKVCHPHPILNRDPWYIATPFSCTGLPVSLHSCIQVRSAQDFQDGRISPRFQVAEVPARRNIC